MLGAGALGRPRGMGWGGSWEGGSGWGTHVNPWLIHVNVWQKPLQYCKVINLQLIKINEKKRLPTKPSKNTSRLTLTLSGHYRLGRLTYPGACLHPRPKALTSSPPNLSRALLCTTHRGADSICIESSVDLPGPKQASSWLQEAMGLELLQFSLFLKASFEHISLL